MHRTPQAGLYESLYGNQRGRLYGKLYKDVCAGIYAIIRQSYSIVCMQVFGLAIADQFDDHKEQSTTTFFLLLTPSSFQDIFDSFKFKSNSNIEQQSVLVIFKFQWSLGEFIFKMP